MRHEKLTRMFPLKRDKGLLLVCALAILCFSQAALAQSGRRQSRNPSPSPPPATIEPKVETPATVPTPKLDLLPVFVVADRIGTYLNLPSGYIDEVVMACVEKLRERAGLEVIQGGNMTRKTASDRAKKETRTYVLYLEMREEGGSDNLAIGYSVFTPGTAKVLTGGVVYLGNKGVGTGKVSVGVPTVAKHLPLQYLLREGGQEVADRVRPKLLQ